MYEAKELNINPEFQRLFRWSIQKKSDFVESILVGIPVPPAFTYENEDGTWELVDGLQRISTVLEFMGVLRDPDKPGKFRKSTLVATKYLPALENVAWSSDDHEMNKPKNLEKSLQLFFRRARFELQVLKHPSDPKTKFDLFQRLNRGGAYATEQEVRTCSMVLANQDFTKSLREWSSTDNFHDMFKLTDKQKESQTDLEYAVRLICHTYVEYDGKGDVQEFLDRSILSIIVDSNFEEVMKPIKGSIDYLRNAFGEDALLPMGSDTSLRKRFTLRALEVIAVGIAKNFDAISKMEDSIAFVKSRVCELWDEPQMAEMTAAGQRGTTRLMRTIPFGTEWFQPNG